MKAANGEDSARAQKASDVLAKKVRAIRDHHCLSQAEMGRKLGLTQPKVAKFELCHSPLHTPDLMRYSRAFDIPLDYLCDDGISVQEMMDHVKSEGVQDEEPKPSEAKPVEPAAAPSRQPHSIPGDKMAQVENFEESILLYMARALGVKNLITQIIRGNVRGEQKASSMTPEYRNGNGGSSEGNSNLGNRMAQ